MKLNKATHAIICSENYTLFKQLLTYLNITHRERRSDILMRVEIFEFIKKMVELANRKKTDPVNVDPFAYYTDGGSYHDDPRYYLHNLFTVTNICHSSIRATDCNI